jgi:hypothetical protein
MEFEPDHVTKEFAEERLLADLALTRTAAHKAIPLSDDWTL